MSNPINGEKAFLLQNQKQSCLSKDTLHGLFGVFAFAGVIIGALTGYLLANHFHASSTIRAFCSLGGGVSGLVVLPSVIVGTIYLAARFLPRSRVGSCLH